MKIACIQLNSADDIARNIDAAHTLVKQAADKGVEFIALPENVFYMGASTQTANAGDDAPRDWFTESDHPGVIAAKAWAKKYNIWLLVGSVSVIPENNPGEKRRYNRSLLLSPEGIITARYDKIHLFDVEVGDGQHYKESAKIIPGDKALVTNIPSTKHQALGATLGLSICYDIRFPHLYRTLAKMGANILTVPAAFTHVTGSAHWHVLNRARAIENGCFVIAPAQCGAHPGNRRTYGHSLIIDPWGKILAEGSEDQPGIITAELDLAQVAISRTRIPSLLHDREFTS